MKTTSTMFSPSGASTRGFVKICGVCTIDDAVLCADLGADAIGMLLTKPGVSRKLGSDRLALDEAASLAAALPVGLKSVLLVDAVQLDDLLRLAEEIKPNAMQIRQPLSPAMLCRLKERFPDQGIIKTISVVSGAPVSSLEDEIRAYVDHGAIDAVLLDSPQGGSGVAHDWVTSASLVERFAGTPVILAGGLSADNVAEARRLVRPYGVDVMSGVTSSERRDRKDPVRLRAFLEACHESPEQ
ncbi:phosphoribosylanthranilate isomerase [Caenimonas aquaedulcis]|uniref:N-(5'-phosphoribosyl)anthranilate isomerase n=1 Tax=Caenimonas aquaedulcis TaxID=2793270 RepID=A0A931H4K1_9BURK|nr:phosphoribosylanthranilate isomerase [Caenimonas aquaedulcis]MBG9388373.1 phosphoribosylanthranilate isomerase [Caenimonas aquaedulcis]